MGTLPDAASLAALIPTELPAEGITAEIDRILHAVRAHLGMDVAFVSEFMDDVRIFRHVDAPGWTPIHTGDAIPLDAGYCKRIVEGLLPTLIADTARLPEAVAIPETQAVPIGAHLSVPIRLSNGTLYGTFCCFGFKADPSLNERDLHIMESFGALVASQVERQIELQRAREARRARIQTLLASEGPEILLQPICELGAGRIVGVAGLPHFAGPPEPEAWFQDAREAGLGFELESATLRKALGLLEQLPADLFLAISLTPATLMDTRFDSLVAKADPARLMLALNGSVSMHDYAAFMQRLIALRERGMRLSVDDAGAGYASMRHILNLHPEMIRLGVSLTRGIDQDPARRALAAALIDFGRQTGSSVLADGVENAAEYALLSKLGACNAQGLFLSPPLALPALLQFVQGRRPAA